MGSFIRRALVDHLSLSVLLPLIRFSYGFALAAMLSKSLGVEEYGNWSLFISNLGLVLTFSSLNLMYAAQVMLIGKDGSEQSREIFSVGSFRLLVTMAAYLVFAIYLYYYEVLPSNLILLLMAALLFRSINDLTFGFLRALLRLKRQVLFLLSESLLILVAIGFSVFVAEGGLEGAVYGFIGAEVIAATLGLWLMREYLRIPSWQGRMLKDYLRIGLPLIPFSFSDLIVNALVPLLLKLHEGAESVALYSIGQKVALVSTIPNAIVNNIYAQYLKRSYLSDKGRGVRRTFIKFLVIYSAMVIPLFVILHTFGQDIIRLISTEAYVQSYDLMILLVVVNVIIMLTAMLTTIFAVYDRTRLVGGIWIGVLLLYLALNQWFVPRYHLMGIAYALLVSFGLGLLLVGLATLWLRHQASSGSLRE